MTGTPALRGGWLTPVRLALIIWTLVSLLILWSNRHDIAALDLSDADDAMRMAQVRDLLGGQGWWDLNQYRVNPGGGGVLMHWSRLVDAPIAAFILILKPFFGQAMAERVVMALWPPAMGAMLAAACALGFQRLPERRIAYVAPAFLVTLGFVLAQFAPLHVDHHGWQILLATLMFWQALRTPSRQAGAIAGICAAALIAISIEGLPMAALFAGLAAVRWALHGRADDRGRLTAYMGALALGAVAFQFLTRGPSGLVATWCDSLSAPYLAAFLVAGAATLAIARAHPASPTARFLLFAGAGVLAAGALVWAEPLCAKGPFATLDPIVVRYWYSGVLEGQPVWASPAHSGIYIVVPSVLGLIGSLLAWRTSEKPEDRLIWTTAIVALAGAFLLSLLVMRSVSTAHIYALPGAAWLGLKVWDFARALRSPLLRVLASVLAALTMPLAASIAAAALLGWLFPVFEPDPKTMAAASYEQICIDPATVAALDRIAPTTVLTPIDVGAPMIFWTHHGVVATGHHRNKEAMADTIRAFISDPATAEPLVRKHKAALIIFCRTANDFTSYRETNAKGLAARLYAGQPPAWLEPVAISGSKGLSVWRVRPAG